MSNPHSSTSLWIQPASNWSALTEKLTQGYHQADLWLQNSEAPLAIADVRALQRFSSQTATGEKKLAVLSGADRWSHVVANALLKLLEEPEEYLELIVLSESDRLLPTVRSRLKLLSVDMTVNSDPWASLLGNFKPIDFTNAEAVRDILYLQAATHLGHDQEKIIRALAH